MSNAAKSAIEIASVQFYPDASGAPTTVKCAGYVFACDFLGGARLTLIRPVAGSRRENEIAARRCEQAYTAFVQANAPEGWVAANTALYTE
jgi:hypothetical protein